ncbi:hypothetical protein RHGRI_010231 [Rhododendron griersonianum]|uniref:Uncharacterized protein n=1 Tax=Rhododendron griersonianum TaxID=479676 RepID=A0AAV6KIW2_9ERIC|nr:hypothetical protein RHGRI_010231 [Rhododendron griersonianum]
MSISYFVHFQALDKIRFLSLTDKEILGEGDDAKLEIQLMVLIVFSCCTTFIEKMQASGDFNLIGQFGVGFYSVYLLADCVEVIGKTNNDKQHVSECSKAVSSS